MLRILIWGTGQGAANYLEKHSEMLDYINILAFVDGKKMDDTTEYFIMPNGIQKNKIPPAQISEHSAILGQFFCLSLEPVGLIDGIDLVSAGETILAVQNSQVRR